MSEFLLPRLKALDPYVPGEQPQDRRYIKLNTNESPFPPSPRVLAALNTQTIERLNLYPDPIAKTLRETIAATKKGSRATPLWGAGETPSHAAREASAARVHIPFQSINASIPKCVYSRPLSRKRHVAPLRLRIRSSPRHKIARDLRLLYLLK